MVATPIILGSIEGFANRVLRLDPDSRYYLKPLAGKVIKINITQFDITLFCCPNREGVHLIDRFDGIPDAVLTGSISAFIAMGRSDSPLSLVTSGKVVIEGDLDTGRKFQALFDRFEPELEEWLSNYTGDVIAHEIGNFARSGQKWLNHLIDSLRMDVSEYLQHESRDLPSRTEVRYFFDKVDKLRADSDRVQVRLNRLEDNLNETSSD